MNIKSLSLALLSLASLPAFAMAPEEKKLFNKAVESFELKLSIKAENCVATIKSVTQPGGACSFFYDKELGFERDVLVAVDRIKKLQEYWKSKGIKNQFDFIVPYTLARKNTSLDEARYLSNLNSKNEYIKYRIRQNLAQSISKADGNFNKHRLRVFQVALSRVREEENRELQARPKYKNEFTKQGTPNADHLMPLMNSNQFSSAALQLNYCRAKL